MRYQFYVEIRSGTVIVGWAAGGMPHLLRGRIAYGVWSHVAIAIRTSGPTAELRLLVDGIPVGSATYPNDRLMAVNDARLVFGGTGFEGDLDEIRLWNIAVGDATIDFQKDRRISGFRPGLIAYWQLEESGQIARDLTLHGHEAILGDLTVSDPADPTWIDDGPI